MNLAVKKIEIIEWLAQLKDEQMIYKVEELRKQSIKNAYESRLKPMSSKTFKAMLDESENDYKTGHVISQEGIEKESEAW